MQFTVPYIALDFSKRDNILVVATNEKLLKLENRSLLVDIGDEDVNRLLGGYMKVIRGYFEQVVCRVRF